MSVLDELTSDSEDSAAPARGGSVLDELADDGEVGRSAEKQTEEAAREELGSAAIAAVKSGDAKAMYQAIADILANEG